MLAAVVLGAGGHVHATDRVGIFGVGTANGGWTLLDPPGYTDAMYDTMARVGTTTTRIGASWADIEQVRGVYDFSQVDEDVAQCLAHGIEPYCLIVNTPAWASPTGEATHEYAPLPQYEPDFQAFCTALAARYAYQVVNWEVWNEQNGYGWHIDGGFNRVDEYVPLLRLAYNALKAGNPACVVAVGGLDDPDISPGDPTGWRGAFYMQLFYAEQASRGWADETLFDAVADHPYHSREQIGDLRLKLRALHNVLDAHGDGDKPIWITEYGWTTKSDDVSQDDQTQLFTQYLSILAEPEFWYVTMASCLAISDMETGYEGWGLTDQNLRPKPAFYAFQSFPRGDAPQISHVNWVPIDMHSVEVSWQTNIPATSQVAYALTPNDSMLTPLDGSLVTQHAVVVDSLSPGAVYRFQVRSTAPTVGASASAGDWFLCPDQTVPNAGFEDGIASGIGRWWRTVGHSFCTDGDKLGTVRSGSHAQAVVTVGGWADRYMDDAIYTYAAMTPGQTYTFSAWTRLDNDTTTFGTLQRRVGTDPTGGTDPDAPTVHWSPAGVDEDVWQQQSVSAIADASAVTLFVRAETVIEEPIWYSMFVDDAELTFDVVVVPPDFDHDGDVDSTDFGHIQGCLGGPGAEVTAPTCLDTRLDADLDVDGDDVLIFIGCMSGAGVPADVACMD